MDIVKDDAFFKLIEEHTSLFYPRYTEDDIDCENGMVSIRAVTLDLCNY